MVLTTKFPPFFNSIPAWEYSTYRKGSFHFINGSTQIEVGYYDPVDDVHAE